jgi:caveolin 3
MEGGCEFAYIAFYHIWCVTPCMRVLEINCGVCQKIYATIINCCLVAIKTVYTFWLSDDVGEK